jgi:plasmid stabilization system protein ParE
MSAILWTETAWHDIDEITAYLFAHGEPFDRVNGIVQRIMKASGYLERFPDAGKPGRMPGTREWRVDHMPYALIYAVRNARIYILRVMHDSRRFPEH